MYKFWDVPKWGERETEGTKESNGISFFIRYDTVNSFETRIPVENLIHSMRKSESNNNNKKLHLRRIRNSPNFMCKYITLWIPFFFAFFYMFSDADIIIRFALREATMVHRRWKKTVLMWRVTHNGKVSGRKTSEKYGQEDEKRTQRKVATIKNAVLMSAYLLECACYVTASVTVWCLRRWYLFYTICKISP